MWSITAAKPLKVLLLLADDMLHYLETPEGRLSLNLASRARVCLEELDAGSPQSCQS